MIARPLLAALTLTLAATVTLGGCEGKDAHIVGPAGAPAFVNYVALGTGLSMGVQSGGVTASMQAQAWPALLARQAGTPFQIPFLRSPGCTPPLIAPLQLARYLSGASAAAPDSSCAGMLGAYTPPLNNLALSGATAWTALTLTPRLVTAPGSAYGAADRGRYAAVLASTQSQVTAMLIAKPTFVSVELGVNEVLGAVTTGLTVPAVSYEQAEPYTFVPASVFAPLYASVADSVKLSGARALLLTVPRVTKLASLRRGAELWNDRAGLTVAGVNVAADCAGSPNLLFTPAIVPALAATALSTGTAQPLSCADVAGAVDFVLTPAEVATLDAVVDQMNAQITALAKQNGWALVDVNAVFDRFATARAPYSAAVQLGCVYPYGQYVSLDGVHPNAAGQQLLANAAAEAANATYGFALPTSPVPAMAAAQLCP